MNKTVIWIISGVVGLALIVLLAVSIANEPTLDESIAFGEVTVEGDPLPFYADPTAGDPTIGFSAPAVSGVDWNDVSTTVEADGRPKILLFLAHWCSHCQAEVPEVVEWMEEGRLGENVDMYSFTIFSDKLRPNWPSQDWLEEAGWNIPVIMDDDVGSVVAAYGVRGTPFYVVLDGENTNLGRFSGQVGKQGLDAMVALAEGA